MSVLADSFAYGSLLDVLWPLLKLKLIDIYFVSVTTIALVDLPLTRMHTAVISDLTHSDNFKSNRPWSRHISPQNAQVTGLPPAHPPLYDPFITSGHPPTNSQLSRQSTRSSSSVPPTVGLADIAPSQLGSGAVPATLAEPSLSPNLIKRKYLGGYYSSLGDKFLHSYRHRYGVVLLELLTGRKPVDMSQPSGQENLVTRTYLMQRHNGRNYPKEDFVRVCTIAAACVTPDANQRPTMGEVVQSLKMVQRLAEYQDAMLSSSVPRPNFYQSSTTFESDRTSSMFLSGPFAGISGFDNENI